MTCADILTLACNIIAETSGDGEAPVGFNARAPYVLAAFCGEARMIDKLYREAFSLGAQPSFDRSYLGLSSVFPLCDRLASSAALYLASALIATESSELSQSLAESCRDSLSAAYGEIPATTHGIKNVYR